MNPLRTPKRRSRSGARRSRSSRADERYVNRRQFAKFLVLTSAGMFVGNLWILIRSWLTGKAGLSDAGRWRGSARSRWAAAGCSTIPAPNDPCILIRPSENEFAAYSQKCTHLSCAVYYAPKNDRFECPCHEGYFSAAGRPGAPGAAAASAAAHPAASARATG